LRLLWAMMAPRPIPDDLLYDGGLANFYRAGRAVNSRVGTSNHQGYHISLTQYRESNRVSGLRPSRSISIKAEDGGPPKIQPDGVYFELSIDRALRFARTQRQGSEVDLWLMDLAGMRPLDDPIMLGKYTTDSVPASALDFLGSFPPRSLTEQTVEAFMSGFNGAARAYRNMESMELERILGRP